jgi:tripartite-type tricarboxylate transporter receptor subunit TctC
MKRFFCALIVFAGVLASSSAVSAQSYPSRPIAIIVPFPNIVEKLNGVFVETFARSEVQQSLAEKGLTLVSREQQTPEALRAYQKEEAARWRPIIKAANIKAE